MARIRHILCATLVISLACQGHFSIINRPDSKEVDYYEDIDFNLLFATEEPNISSETTTVPNSNEIVQRTNGEQENSQDQHQNVNECVPNNLDGQNFTFQYRSIFCDPQGTTDQPNSQEKTTDGQNLTPESQNGESTISSIILITENPNSLNPNTDGQIDVVTIKPSATTNTQGNIIFPNPSEITSIQANAESTSPPEIPNSQTENQDSVTSTTPGLVPVRQDSDNTTISTTTPNLTPGDQNNYPISQGLGSQSVVTTTELNLTPNFQGVLTQRPPVTGLLTQGIVNIIRPGVNPLSQSGNTFMNPGSVAPVRPSVNIIHPPTRPGTGPFLQAPPVGPGIGPFLQVPPMIPGTGTFFQGGMPPLRPATGPFLQVGVPPMRPGTGPFLQIGVSPFNPGVNNFQFSAPPVRPGYGPGGPILQAGGPPMRRGPFSQLHPGRPGVGPFLQGGVLMRPGAGPYTQVGAPLFRPGAGPYQQIGMPPVQQIGVPAMGGGVGPFMCGVPQPHPGAGPIRHGSSVILNAWPFCHGGVPPLILNFP